MPIVTVYPTTYAAMGGWVAWNSPANVYADDSVYATATPGPGATDNGNLFGGFGLDAIIPAGSTINSVTESAQYKMTGSGSDTYTFGLQPWLAGVAYGTEKTDTTQPAVDTVVSNVVTGLARNDLLDATFKLGCRASVGFSGGKTFNADYVKLVVDYTPPVSTNGNFLMFAS